MLNLEQEVDSYPKSAGLVIVRGTPGSGKSTFAKALSKKLTVPLPEEPRLLKYGAFHYEADDYFIRPDGVCDFNPNLLKNAHEFCFTKLTNYILCGLRVKSEYVGILANTSTRIWEMERYINFAKENNIFLRVYRMVSEYQNTHNVPAETIQKMKDRFEDFEGEILVDKYE